MSSNKPGDTRPCVSCSLTPELNRLLTVHAEGHGVSRAAVLREALEAYFTTAWPRPSPGRAWELDADHEQEPSR